MGEWKCDRCGKVLNSNNKKDFNCLNIDSWGSGRKGPFYICEECFSWFTAFMDGDPLKREVALDDYEDELDLEGF